MRAWAAGVAALAVIAAQAPATLSPTAFRDRLAASVRAQTGRPTVPTGPQSFRTTAADGTELTINSDNGYAQYLADPSQLDAIVARYARLLTGADTDANVEQLVVIVRPSDYIARSMSAAATTNFVPARPMAGDLSYFLAIDSPETIRLAVPADLVRWRLDSAGAWARGVQNVKRRMGPMQIVRIGDEEGPSGLGAESGLAPSILADPALCGSAAPTGSNRQIVLVVARDTFIFAAPADTEETRRFWLAAKRLQSTRQSLSSTPLTCSGGRWVVAQTP